MSLFTFKKSSSTHCGLTFSIVFDRKRNVPIGSTTICSSYLRTTNAACEQSSRPGYFTFFF